jgi:Zn-dependent protease with chaperone function
MISQLLVGLAMFGANHSAIHINALTESSWQGEAQTKAERDHQADLKEDVELGKKYAEQADKELKISKDAETLARIKRIGDQLAAIANQNQVRVSWGDKRLNPFEYSFKLVEDKDVNAFSLPGGFIYVNDGLVSYCESDDELAGVLAHEIAHASLRHIATLRREQEKLSAVTLPLILISIMTGAAAEGLTASSLIGAAKGSGWSVQAEEAADFAGFQYMLKSGYDPTGMLTVMERLAKDERSRPAIDWGIFRTHPPGRERADALTNYMRDGGIPIRRSVVATSFRATAKPNDKGQVEILYGGKHIVTLSGQDAAMRADKVVSRLNEFFDSMPELYDLSMGEQGSILGSRQTLVTVTTTDASGLGKNQKDLQTETIKNLRTALFNMAYRVWDAR